MDLRRKATNLALEMVSSRNVEDVVLFFKKELIKTLSETFEKVCHFWYCHISKYGILPDTLRHYAFFLLYRTQNIDNY